MTEQLEGLRFAVTSLFNAFTWTQLVPSLTLAFIVFVLYRALGRAHTNESNELNLVEFFKTDEVAKLSWRKLMGSCCFIIHAWMMYTRTVNDKITFNETVLFVAVWSSSVVVLRALDIYREIKLGKAPDAGTAVRT